MERNIDIAIRLACKIGGAPAEISGRLAHLSAMKEQSAPAEFSWCDDITSGLSSAYCADHSARIQSRKRETRLAEIAARWTGLASSQFTRLTKASEAYATALGNNEVSPMGTAHAALEIDARESVLNQFMQDMEAYAAGKPLFAEAVAAADARLNTAYRKIMSISEETFREDTGGITQAGIKETQRAWLKFRDAWVAFVVATDPAIPKSTIVNWLTVRRTAQLREFTE